MRKIIIVIFSLSLVLITFAQQNNVFTGNLSVDAKNVLKEYKQPLQNSVMLDSPNKKSPALAGILSLLVPGAGEIYSGEYLKAGIFVAIEAAVVTTAIIYDNKGDRKTNEFQDYADAYKNPDHNWSVIRYAKWVVQYEHSNDPELLNRILLSDDPNLPPWEQINWLALNEAETGSHKLAPHGEQQYYELIGKYHQYSPGWNDFNGGGDISQVSPNLLYYSSMRGDANDLYAVASTAVIGIYVNHVLSALDAVWSSIQHNKDLAVKVRLENIQLTQNRAVFYPVLHLSYNF